ncbi:MAG: RHS repeat protein, partial [Proteobacteria bacterium]
QLARTIQYVEHRMTPPGAAAISEATAMAWVAGLADKSSVRITQTSYDARGNAVTTTAYGIASTAGEPLTSEGTSAAHFTYDQAGNLIERHAAGGVSETFVYDGMGRLTSSVDVHGGTTTIVFNDAATTTTVTTALGYTSVSTYNKAGELISKADSGANTVGGTDSYQYDAAGRLRMVTDATGRKSYFYYDKAGRKVAEANYLGEITEYRYDAAGRMVASITYASALGSTALTAMGNPASTADFSTLRPTANAADVWSWSIYDDAGNLIQAIDNLGGTFVYEYDTENKLAKTTAFFNTLTASQLTSFRATLPTSAVLPTAHAKDSVSRVFYNKAGQLIGSLDGEGYLTELTRDGAGLEIQRITYSAQTNAADRATASLGTLKAQVSGSLSSSQIAYSVYDGQGLLRYTVNVNGGITGLEYDAAGRLTKTTAYANPQALTDFTYDAVKAAITTNAADRISWTVYDTAGRAAYTVDAEGGVTAMSYDTQGRVTKVVAFDNTYASTVSLAALNSWAGNTTQTSDAKNRITHSRYSERGELLYAVDAEGYATRYTYD